MATPLAPTRVRSQPRINGRLLVGAAVVSLVTMPITAIMFLALAPLVAFTGALIAVFRREPADKDRTVRTAASLALGILAGPAVYIGLAIVLAI